MAKINQTEIFIPNDNIGFLMVATFAVVVAVFFSISGCEDQSQEQLSYELEQDKKHREFCWDNGLQAKMYGSGPWENRTCYEDMGEDTLTYQVRHIIYANNKGIDFKTRFEARNNVAD